MRYTSRERQIVRLFALGWTWRNIEEELGITRSTLGSHWQSIMNKSPGAQCHIDVLRVIGWLRVP